MKNGKLTIREMAVFAMLGALMYASKMIMEVAPNSPPPWCFYDCVYRGISEKSIVSHLYICAPERDILRFCHLVDPLPVSVGSAVGSDHAVTKTDSGEASSACLYAAVCCPWLFIRNFVCTGAGTAVRFKLSENGCLDHQWAALGFRAWCQ